MSLSGGRPDRGASYNNGRPLAAGRAGAAVGGSARPARVGDAAGQCSAGDCAAAGDDDLGDTAGGARGSPGVREAD